jgi:carboxyl-terminal processing protease
MNGLKKSIWIVSIVLFVSLLGFFGGWISGESRSTGDEVSLSEDGYESLRPLIQSLSLIRNNYVDVEKTKQKDLVYGAIKGMVAELDPYSQFMDPQNYKDMKQDTEGAFGGLGIEIAVRDNQLTIVTPIDGTPAQRAGVQPGDWIVKIDGETTDGISIMDAVHKMRGPKGTKCVISVQRRGVKEWFDVAIVRDIIKIQSVRSEMLEGDMGYIRITEFMEKTGDDFEQALKELEDKNMKGILDLRNNPGGLLNMAAEIAEYFVPQGKLIVYTEGRHKSQDIKFFSSAKHSYQGKPLVVLVNQGSASASEIVAGAIQDWKLGIIVGEKSFGKGSVQTIIPLGDGSALRITTARYLTPKGQMIHGNGITPDIEAPQFMPNEFALQLQNNRRFEEFAGTFLTKHPKGEEIEKPEKPVNVSEKSWNKLKPKSQDDKLKEAFITWMKEQHLDVNPAEFNEDQSFILNQIRQEIALKLHGQTAQRKIQLEGDLQIQRALDALKISLMVKN